MKVHYVGLNAQERAWAMAWRSANRGIKVQLDRDVTGIWTVTF